MVSAEDTHIPEEGMKKEESPLQGINNLQTKDFHVSHYPNCYARFNPVVLFESSLNVRNEC